MIDIDHVSKSYNRGAIRAVDDLTLAMEPGEIFGFLGPNGAGKTTLIKMIVGLLRPDAGTIRIDGVDIRREPLRCKRAVTYVPDTPDVYERLTGMEYLQFIGDVYGAPAARRRERIARWAEVFELTSALRSPIQSYSHGMRQKVVLMAALLPEVRAIILDEPLVGLDPRSSAELKGALREHCREGGTVFFSTHIMEVAERLCDRVGIIHRGRLVALGTLADLKERTGSDRTLESIFLEATQS